MRTIKVQKLTREAFAPFGTFYNFMDPQGLAFGTFYPDRLEVPTSGKMSYCFSGLTTDKPAEYIVNAAEYHNTTAEIMVPLDGDVIIHVAPASNKPVPELTEAFYVPAGTLIKYRVGAWHLGPFAVKDQTVHMIVGLPERTYMNDCVVVNYDEADWTKIEL